MKLLDSGDVDRIKETFGDKLAPIVDGQHRFSELIGTWNRNPEFMPRIPALLFFGLSFIDEAELFNTINVNQRKLPKAWIETTRGDITDVNYARYGQQIRRITFSLFRDDHSVWGPKDSIEQINMTGVRDRNRPVTYEGLRRSKMNIFPKLLLTRLSAIDESLPLKYAKKYWQQVSEACAEAWNGTPDTRTVIDSDTSEPREEKSKYRIKDLVGVASLAKLGQNVIQTRIDSGEADKLDSLVSKLVEFDWEIKDLRPLG